MNVRSRQFTKSYLSGGLYKIPVRTGLDLGRKISIKILSVLMQKLDFVFMEGDASRPSLDTRRQNVLLRSSQYTASLIV